VELNALLRTVGRLALVAIHCKLCKIEPSLSSTNTLALRSARRPLRTQPPTEISLPIQLHRSFSGAPRMLRTATRPYARE
jgi:hypothetical protein